MRAKSLLLILLLGIFLSSLASGETDLLNQIKTGKLSQTALQEYVLTLDEGGVLNLADKAFENGWDPYAVTVGILGPYYESKGIIFTTEKKIAILNNSKMHPAFREYAAAWGLKDRSLDLVAFLSLADEALLFFEDETVEYIQKQGVPEYLREALQRRADDIREKPGDKEHRSQALDEIHSRGIRVMNDLVSSLENNPQPSKERVDYSASSFAAASLSKYAGWCLSEVESPTESTQKYRDAVHNAHRALKAILEDPKYDPAAARTVLRFAEESGLDQALSTDTVAKIKKDARFSGEEDQRLLDALHQRIQAKRGP